MCVCVCVCVCFVIDLSIPFCLLSILVVCVLLFVSSSSLGVDDVVACLLFSILIVEWLSSR